MTSRRRCAAPNCPLTCHLFVLAPSAIGGNHDTRSQPFDVVRAQQEFEGHTNVVAAVRFTPNGDRSFSKAGKKGRGFNNLIQHCRRLFTALAFADLLKTVNQAGFANLTEAYSDLVDSGSRNDHPAGDLCGTQVLVKHQNDQIPRLQLRLSAGSLSNEQSLLVTPIRL